MCFGSSTGSGGSYGGGPFSPSGWQPNYGFPMFTPPMSSSFGAPTPQAPSLAPAPQPAMSPAPSQSSTPPWMSQLPPQLQSMMSSGSADFPSMMNSLMQWWQTQGNQGQGQQGASPQAAAPSTPAAPSAQLPAPSSAPPFPTTSNAAMAPPGAPPAAPSAPPTPTPPVGSIPPNSLAAIDPAKQLQGLPFGIPAGGQLLSSIFGPGGMLRG